MQPTFLKRTIKAIPENSIDTKIREAEEFLIHNMPN